MLRAQEVSIPDAKSVWRVPVDGSRFEGRGDAEVTIIKYVDLLDPFSRRAEGTLKNLQAKYGSRLRIVFKHGPHSFHPDAAGAHRALVLALWRGRSLSTSADALFAARPDALANTLLGLGIGPSDLPDIALGELRATSPGSGQVLQARLDQDAFLARSLHEQGTPTFFINRRLLGGVQPQEKFESLIKEGLTAANAALARGVPRADL